MYSSWVKYELRIANRHRHNFYARDAFGELKLDMPKWGPDNPAWVSSFGLHKALLLPKSMWLERLAWSLVIAKVPNPIEGCHDVFVG
jgi:hypothetical protein